MRRLLRALLLRVLGRLIASGLRLYRWTGQPADDALYIAHWHSRPERRYRSGFLD